MWWLNTTLICQVSLGQEFWQSSSKKFFASAYIDYITHYTRVSSAGTGISMMAYHSPGSHTVSHHLIVQPRREAEASSILNTELESSKNINSTAFVWSKETVA